MNYYSRQYLSTQVTTANAKSLIVYLYDAAIHHVRKALDDLQQRRPAPCGKHLGAALDILIELAAALDFDASPQLAERLQTLYNYLIETLALAQKEKDPKQLRSCMAVLSTLGNAWRHVTRDNSRVPAKPSAPEPERREESIALAV